MKNSMWTGVTNPPFLWERNCCAVTFLYLDGVVREAMRSPHLLETFLCLHTRQLCLLNQTPTAWLFFLSPLWKNAFKSLQFKSDNKHVLSNVGLKSRKPSIQSKPSRCCLIVVIRCCYVRLHTNLSVRSRLCVNLPALKARKNIIFWMISLAMIVLCYFIFNGFRWRSILRQ